MRSSVPKKVVFSIILVLFLSSIALAQPITFLVNPDYDPFSYLEEGHLKGFLVDLIGSLESETGIDVEMKPVKFDEALEMLQGEGRYCIPSLVFTTQRKAHYQWAGPVAITNTYLYTTEELSGEFKSLEHARNANSVGVVIEYYSHKLLEEQGFDNLIVFEDEESLLEALFEGEIELAPFNSAVLQELLKREKASYSPVSTVAIDLDMTYLGFSKDVPSEIVDAFQKALDGLKSSGSFSDLYSEWFPEQPVPGIYTFLTEEYPPVTFRGEDGEPTGFVTEMVKEILRRNDMSAEILIVPWSIGYELASNLPNVFLFSMDQTEQRKENFEWIGPVGKNTAYLYGRKDTDTPATDLESAKKVGAIGTTTNWWTEQLLKEMGFENLVSSLDPLDTVAQLVEGETDLAVFTDLTVAELADEAGYSIDDLEALVELQTNYFYIAASKGTNLGLILNFQKTLEEMKRDGSFEETIREFVPNMLVTSLLWNSSQLDVKGLRTSMNTLSVGEIATMELQENGSTGYVWDVKITNPNVVSLIYEGSIFEAKFLDDSELVGTPYNVQWVFKAKQPGVTVVIFSLRRPWESVHPIQTFAINIAVE
ncbi:transporter substrate-binding domain-containing protein [Mesotoga prima]|uniref:transporter substrate-binding domain-containing protein n=1 Tax=Mesotoga prima TaxID=1184387 RepID=UPI002BD765DA|nr:transporter substrate-binding domain-containing protein [Mesotoga prima]HQC15046.1 transporter substrate-binding domain-containing protein [Mesotoga prima]